MIVTFTCMSPGESSLSLLLTLWRCRPLLSALWPQAQPAPPSPPPPSESGPLQAQPPAKKAPCSNSRGLSQGIPTRDDLRGPSTHSVSKYLSKVFSAPDALSDAGHSAVNKQTETSALVGSHPSTVTIVTGLEHHSVLPHLSRELEASRGHRQHLPPGSP